MESEMRILKALYELYREHGPAFIINGRSLAQDLELEEGETIRILNRFVSEGYVEYWELGEAYRISSSGIDYMESRKDELLS